MLTHGELKLESVSLGCLYLAEWNNGMTTPTECFVTTYTIVFAHWSSQIMDKAVAVFKKDEHKTDPGEE